METNQVKRAMNEYKAKQALLDGEISIKIDNKPVSILSLKENHSTELGRIKILKSFHSNGQLKDIQIYDKIAKTRQVTEFDKYGNLTHHNTYSENKKEKQIGVSVGNLLDTIIDYNYGENDDNKGLLIGFNREFFPDGKLKIEYIPKNFYREWDENGNLIKERLK